MSVANKGVERYLQQRHILSSLGVPLWVSRDAKLAEMACGNFDRMQMDSVALPNITDDNTDNTATPNAEATTAPSAPVVQAVQDGKVAKSALDGLSDKASDKPSAEPSNASENSEKTDQSDTAKIRYTMQGVRYGEWVLIVDLAHLGGHLPTWQALTNALEKHAQKTNQAFLRHDVRYPLTQHGETSAALAQSCFMGFMAQLMAGGAPQIAQSVAFLSQIADGVDYFGEMQTLPDIQTLSQNPNAKKQLWQRVVG
ncbi:hypothetical protein B0181_03070 [Moraxella caviae]|uniref:Uncharacterized protein n=1 Tax=Moraxella caviae TaxID=34060 RepID=A0A1T0A7A4_9GAMM|nr:hypothetical protein [Moraxella caviae]OOR91550.1 hypothetical protein B0181_03070 [Moraxella caviae]STZ14365.1 Uncharacterised protein [Moraxella caviae]VEW12810.1 Uncharacterised protein [Moraxella caviae]